MKAAALVARSDSYSDDGLCVINDLITPDVTRLMMRYVQVVEQAGEVETDQQVPGSLRRYGLSGFEALLDLCVPAVSAAVGEPVIPTYSFFRMYKKGQGLTAHRDRPACEHSATLHLGASEPCRWPISLKTRSGPTEAVVLRPGDAAIYRGDELLHWRDPLPADWYAQVFLHFVSESGPHADQILDGRPHLAAERYP